MTPWFLLVALVSYLLGHGVGKASMQAVLAELLDDEVDDDAPSYGHVRVLMAVPLDSVDPSLIPEGEYDEGDEL